MQKAATDVGRPVATLADIEAIESIPLGLRDIPATTYEMLAQGASVAPSSPALTFFLRTGDFRNPHVWSHQALLSDITRAANALRRLGIGRQDVVAFVLPNLPETHFMIWGGETAGIAFAINPLLETQRIAEVLSASNAKWLVTLAPTPETDIWEKTTRAAASVLSLKGILTVSVGPYVRGLAGVAFRALSRLKKPKAAGLKLPILELRREMAKESGDALDFDLPQPSDVASYICTGGTTGLPKIAARTHAAEVFDSWATQTFVAGMSGPGASVFCGLPLFHVLGQIVTGLTPWSQGAHVVMGTAQGYRGKGLVAAFWDIVQHYRIDAFSGVPTLYAALLQVPVAGRDLSSIKFGFCGAATMPVELFRNFETTTGIKILEAYGLTEGTCVASVNPPAGERRIGSIGLRLPYQRMAVLRLDEAGGKASYAALDEAGCLAISGPNVFAGYVNPEHNNGIWVVIDGVRWLITGDLGRQDGDGYFWLTGRKKELIIRGGHNIDPRIVEDALLHHPAVQVAAAIGRPDAYSGELPVAYVQLKPGAAASQDDLLSEAIKRIPERAAHPKFVKVLPAMPVTPVGKVFKPALSMLEMEDVVRHEADVTGVVLASVTVVQDAKCGLLARITAEGSNAALRAALGRYAFQYEFT